MCQGLAIDDVGVSRDTVFQEIRPGAAFETGDFAKEKSGGATVERLRATSILAHTVLPLLPLLS